MKLDINSDRFYALQKLQELMWSKNYLLYFRKKNRSEFAFPT